MRYANWGLIMDEIAIAEGRPPNTLVSSDERRARAMALMVEVMQLAAKLGLGKTVLARELGITRISLYYWQDGSAVPGLKNYHKLLGLRLELEKMAFKQGLISHPSRPYAGAAQQILILAISLGYKLYQVADALGVVEGTVKRWHRGKVEPGVDSWPKLLALKEQLVITGKLLIVSENAKIRQTPANFLGEGAAKR